jgi:hypothetical protein
MASRYDIKLIDNDPVFENGDFAIDISDQQHIQDTIQAFPGWWKQYPDEGVGILKWIGGPADPQAAAKSIRLNLTNDGYTVVNPTIKFDAAGQLIINPNATI